VNLNEAAVFRWVVIIGIAAAAVIAVTLLTRPLVGALLGLALVIWGSWHAIQRLRQKRR
jgi:predicted membrane metal-binding protein